MRLYSVSLEREKKKKRNRERERERGGRREGWGKKYISRKKVKKI